MNKKILIVEDEPNIRELLRYNLTAEGYQIAEAEDGIKAEKMIKSEKPDLILLDLMLPEKSGLDICRELREDGQKIPIIMLTAKTEEIDRILGLEFGADDYVSKPFSVRELMARIKAVLRRYEPDKEEEKESNYIEIGDLTVDIDRYEVRVRGELISLTLKEFELLTFLAVNRGIVFSRDQLLDRVWGIDYSGETRTVDVHIRHLRKKLFDDGEEEKYIHTVRGRGYKIL